MITAKDLHDKMKSGEEYHNFLVDDWLSRTVMPTFRKNGQGFQPPHLVPLEVCMSLLCERGFYVTHGKFSGELYITIPPQQE
tara:strand:- start:1639 stop:1884 length:246 start_codon:yes stop_codon:yes gene_type:complete